MVCNDPKRVWVRFHVVGLVKEINASELYCYQKILAYRVASANRCNL